jgi:hypothetical protein
MLLCPTQAVAEVERACRQDTVWFGGVDVHHVYFEGLTYDRKFNGWYCFWGS